MRGLLVLGIALLLAGLTWWMADDESTPLPGAAEHESPVHPEVPQSGAPLTAERIEMAETPETPPEETRETLTPERRDQPLAEGQGRLRIEVRSHLGQNTVPAFRYVRWTDDGARDAGQVEGNELAMTVPLGERVTFTIEAEGYEPSEPVQMVASYGEREPHRTVYLVPKSMAAGVELRVRNELQAPVQHLEVEALQVGNDGTPKTIWKRRTNNSEGTYLLPDLRPGSYTLRLHALNGSYLPHVEEITFNGTERIRRQIVLRPGCDLLVTVRSADGAMRGKEVNLRLTHPDGTAPSWTWVAEVDGAGLRRTDGLPAAAAARSAQPLPPGRYVVAARVGGGAVVDRVVDLSPGQTTGVTLVVP